jgi:hypothetical protein
LLSGNLRPKGRRVSRKEGEQKCDVQQTGILASNWPASLAPAHLRPRSPICRKRTDTANQKSDAAQSTTRVSIEHADNNQPAHDTVVLLKRKI